MPGRSSRASQTKIVNETPTRPGAAPGVCRAVLQAAPAWIGTVVWPHGGDQARVAAYSGDMPERRSASLGEFIRAQRELSEVSMRHFAEMVGISNPYLSQIERGLRAPSEAVLQSIADVLQVSAETLFDQAGVPREEAGPSKVVEAIREDPRLTGRQRQALIETYEAFVGVGARPRRS